MATAEMRASAKAKGNQLPKLITDTLVVMKEIGAGEAIRTPDPNLGKVMLYP